MNRHDYFERRVEPFPITERASAGEVVERMGKTAFQARNIAQAARIWRRMLEDDVTIMFGLAGAMIPAGMREVVVYLIQHRLIDCVVSTGANLFHDVYETLGKPHWQSSPDEDDVELGHRRINRFYDVLAPETDFTQAEEFCVSFASSLDPTRPYTTREYFELMGRALIPQAQQEGILTAAAKAGVPVFTAALGDSVHGLSIASSRLRSGQRLLFDIIGDVLETGWISLTANGTGVIYIGGGTPKNFIQQSEVASYIFQRDLPGHRYGIQITMDQPQWGGLSGCTFEEAQSWRKIAPDANTVTVNVEATVALPLIVQALAEEAKDVIARRRAPVFDFSKMPGRFEGRVQPEGVAARARL
ncbi:MAG TPA: deoxyhypusine synthase family protein [Dehalococcoidia bacterium]|nr:deoxyhypusine synthase family protein [Dehalococcoidia bacterium]